MKLGADLNVYGVLCLVPVAILILFGCGQPGAKSKPPPSPIRVTVSHPAQRAIIEWDEYTGRLEAIDSVEVRARVSGYLQSIHFTDGAMVKQGDLLFVIDPRPYRAALDRAQAQVIQAQARLALAGARLKRAQWLLERNAASQEDYDTQLGERRARVRLPGSARYEAILIPDEAIGSDQSRRYVYVVNSDHIVERRLVELGPMSHGLRIIRQGLSANDWIITQGLQRARPDAQVEPFKEQIRVESNADDPSYAAPEGNSVEQ